MKNTLNFINTFDFLKEKEITAFSEKLNLKHFKKDDYLIKEGKYCKEVCFLESGSARAFHNINGNDITNWFVFNHMPLTSYFSFVTQSPSKETIQFLEDTTLYSINYNELQILYKEFHGIERLGREIAEFYFIWQEERTLSLQSLSAKERYEKLLIQEAHLLQKVSLGQIASYLGITQESLSRIRKNI
jgi:CRP-like cAMP-binding protein